MKRWKIALFLILIFLAGAASGSIVTRMMMKKRNVGLMQEIQGRAPGVMINKIYTRLDKRLHFKPEQEEPVRSAIASFLNDFSALRKQQRQEIRSIFEKSIGYMKSALNDAQILELDRIIKKIQERRARDEES
jgi:hypothetical protein